MRNVGRTVQLLRASSVSIACTYLVYLVVFLEEEKVKKAATYTRLMMSQPHASVWTQMGPASLGSLSGLQSDGGWGWSHWDDFFTRLFGTAETARGSLSEPLLYFSLPLPPYLCHYCSLFTRGYVGLSHTIVVSGKSYPLCAA